MPVNTASFNKQHATQYLSCYCLAATEKQMLD